MADEDLIVQDANEPDTTDAAADDHELLGLPKPEEKPAQKEAQAAIPAEVGIEALQAQLDKAIADKHAAEARARKAEETSYAALTDKHETDLQLVDSAIKEMERNREILLAGLEEANASGDHRRAAEIQDELSETRANLTALKNGFDELKNRKVEKPAAPVPVTDTEKVEHFAGQLTAKSAAWVRSHPECVTDPKLFKKMIRAHEWAEANDITFDTPEYFATLDKMLGYDKPASTASTAAADNPMSSAAAVAEAPMVAPVTRGGESSKTVVTLTRAEKEAAEASGLTPLEYAKHKMQLQKEGKLGTRH